MLPLLHRRSLALSGRGRHWLSRTAILLIVLRASILMLSAQTAAPTISTQPKSLTVNAGTALTFTVVAAGTPLTYQWEFNGVAIAGATAASYALASATPANAGTYAVVVTNSIGSTTSSNATLLIYVPYVVSTLAGQALTTGTTDATGAAARFDNPEGIAVDSAGMVYVVDTVNCTIRKVTPAGVVSTLAGTPGVAGSSDGTGSAAQFNYPAGIAVDSAGNLYVADTFNSTIRKITPAGGVTTLAGLAPTAAVPSPENSGSANGTGAAARFNFPRGVAVDGADNVYVADTLNSTVRKITPAGVVTTLAGNPAQTPQTLDGTGAAALFDYPFGIAVNSAGSIWVADTSGQTIRAVTPAGVVTTIGGLAGNAGSAGGAGAVARFNSPTAIAVDGTGNLYIADTNNSLVREITPDGTVVTLAGLAGNTGSVNASGSSARLFFPYGIAVDSAGNLYLADTYNAEVRLASAQSPVQFAPTIQTQPSSQTVNIGATAVLSVSASGNPAPSYQWSLAGTPVAGATSAILTLTNVQPSSAGSYTVTVTNTIGSVTSNAAVLTVTFPPVISVQPSSQSPYAGATINVAVTASGATSYQWSLNGVPLPGATSTTLALNNIGTNQAGSYTVVLTNSAGSVTSAPAVVTVPYNARLTNLSARANVGTGANVLAAGFSLSGGSTKQVLLRGVGPTLGTAQFNVPNALAHPQLTLFDAGSVAIATNLGWSNPSTAGPSTVSAQISPATAGLMASLGAFPLTAGSADSAMVATLGTTPPGNYSVNVSGVNTTTGIALAEIYDADASNAPSRLTNISARANTGVGANVLTAGFVIVGTTSETVLLRGIGPGLTPFGITGVLARPQITVLSGNTSLATNAGWGGSAALSSVFAQVGAFALAPTSADAALVVTLAPGVYSAQVSGVSNTSGVALIEVYEVP